MKCEMALYCVFALSLTSNISICALTTVFARSDRWQNFWQNVQNKANSAELSWLFDLNERINQPPATFVTWNAFFLVQEIRFSSVNKLSFSWLQMSLLLILLRNHGPIFSIFRFYSFHLMTTMLEFPTRESLRCFKDSMKWMFMTIFTFLLTTTSD